MYDPALLIEAMSDVCLIDGECGKAIKHYRSLQMLFMWNIEETIAREYLLVI